MTLIILACVLWSGVLAVAETERRSPFEKKVRVTLEVVDEEGSPVAGARAGDFDPFPGAQPSSDEEVAGNTDERGVYTYTIYSMGAIYCGARMEGYYSTGFRLEHGEEAPRGVALGRRWPDVTKRIMIRPIGNPVPMYVYPFSRAIPKEGEEIGFDFLKADWVAPHGKGEDADVLVNIITYDPDRQAGGEFSWRFPRPGDGMIRTDLPEEYANSQFKMRREAPEDGYVSEWRVVRDYREVDWMEAVSERKTGKYIRVTPEGPLLWETPFFIRIRSVLDDKGRVKSALYGKIVRYPGFEEGIRFLYADNKKRARVSFTYYINPDGTRNMEWDPKRNLFESIIKPQDHKPKHP